MKKFRVNSRVRLVSSPSAVGVVIRVVKGSAQDAVLVKWGHRILDSHWNWSVGESWEPAAHLESV